jgi:hypothetical protein
MPQVKDSTPTEIREEIPHEGEKDSTASEGSDTYVDEGSPSESHGIC